MTYSEAKTVIEEIDRNGLEELIDQYGEEVIQAALACDVSPGDIEEAYAGQYDSDEDFTEELLESCGDIPKDLPCYVHIDWSATAHDIMMDYSEHSGYYFRSL